MDHIQNQIFDSVFPGMLHRPMEALMGCKQDITATHGNTTKLSVQVYFTKIVTAMSYMKEKLDMDVITYAVDNMNYDIKYEMEVT